MRTFGRVELQLPVAAAGVLWESLCRYSELNNPPRRSFIVPGIFSLDNVVSVSALVIEDRDLCMTPEYSPSLCVHKQEKVSISFDFVLETEVPNV